MQYDRQGFFEAEDGTPIWYGVRAGQGGTKTPPVVLNDGLGCDGFAWKYIQPALAEDRDVVHWHYRGHGRSGPPRDRARIDIPALSRDLAGLLDHLRLRRPVLIGHSLGTQVSLELARNAPERAAAHVLVCGTYGKVTHTFHGTDILKDLLPRLIEGVQKNRGLARALWGSVPPGVAFRLARLSGEVDVLALREEDFRHYWEHIRWMDPDLFLAMLRAAGEHSAESVLPRLVAPTLVFVAEKDTFIPPDLTRAMAGAIPDAELEVIPGGSHAAPVEQPELLVDRIRRFLRERVDGAGALPRPRPSARAHPAAAPWSEGEGRRGGAADGSPGPRDRG